MGPSVLFFLLSILELKFTLSSSNKRIAINGYNATRMVVCFLGNYSSLTLLVNYLINYDDYTPSDLVASVSKILAFVSKSDDHIVNLKMVLQLEI